MRKIIGVDLDNTLCEGKSWRRGMDCRKAKPIKGMIDKVNRLYENNFIVIYTARQNFLMSGTFDWLEKHNVHYHALSNKKVPFDYTIDDIGEPDE